MHVQINTQSATTSPRRMALIFLLGSMFSTHPTALPDPVTQPPVTEGYAASRAEEEEEVDDENYWTTCCFDVGPVNRPADITRALLLGFHQLFCVMKETGNMFHLTIPQGNIYLAAIPQGWKQHEQWQSLTSFLALHPLSDIGDTDGTVRLFCSCPPLFVL